MFVVVSDTSPVANLILIGKLDFLRHVFHRMIVPPAVNKEIEALQAFHVDLSPYRTSNWIDVKTPSNREEVRAFMLSLDQGEAEAIVLAKEIGADFLLIDERLGTNRAIQEGLNTIGLIGVLVKAKKMGVVDLLEPILVQLKETAGFWIGNKLLETVLIEVGER